MASNKTSVYTLSWWEKMLYWMVFSILYMFSFLPFSIHYMFSNLIYILAYKIVGYRVNLVRKNMKESFPEKSVKELRALESAFYHFLADYVVETVKLLSISQESIKRHIVFEGMEHINDAVAKGRSVTLYLGHNGNWEWITSIGLHIKGEFFGGQVYHVLENKIFDKLFLHLRSRMSTHSVPIQDILRKRVECKQRGMTMVMGYISDQVPFWNNIHYWTDFLHHDTPVLTGAERLTKRFNDHAVYLDVIREKRGFYRVVIIPLVEGETKNIPDFEITERYFRLLEQSIKRQPEIWLWTHNRWKRTREEYNERNNNKK